MVGNFTWALFTACFTTQQVDQTFIMAMKTMVDFVTHFSGKASKYVKKCYVLTHLKPRTLTLSTLQFF